MQVCTKLNSLCIGIFLPIEDCGEREVAGLVLYFSKYGMSNDVHSQSLTFTFTDFTTWSFL